MSVHIGEMTSTVVPQAEPGSLGTSAESTHAVWREVERLRQAKARLASLPRRTGSEGYDD